MEPKKGMPAISKAGHDKTGWYIILNIEENHALLVNGTNRTMDYPKKKKLKHLQFVNEVPDILKEKLQTGEPWTNEEIKRALKLAKQD